MPYPPLLVSLALTFRTRFPAIFQATICTEPFGPSYPSYANCSPSAMVFSSLHHPSSSSQSASSQSSSSPAIARTSSSSVSIMFHISHAPAKKEREIKEESRGQHSQPLKSPELSAHFRSSTPTSLFTLSTISSPLGSAYGFA